jgi:hypothetical protein
MERDFNIHNWQAKFLKEESSNTKTAIEWLESKFDEFETIYDSLPAGLYEYVNQAKEMEKQQIIDAYKAAEDQCEYFIEEHKWNRYYETAEPYYNNKYK